MTGCRIGRVRMKNGGADVHILRTEDVSWCSRAPRNMASLVQGDTLLAGWLVMQGDRIVRTGWSYVAGITNSDLLGGLEILRAEIMAKEILKPN